MYASRVAIDRSIDEKRRVVSVVHRSNAQSPNRPTDRPTVRRRSRSDEIYPLARVPSIHPFRRRRRHRAPKSNLPLYHTNIRVIHHRHRRHHTHPSSSTRAMTKIIIHHKLHPTDGIFLDTIPRNASRITRIKHHHHHRWVRAVRDDRRQTHRIASRMLHVPLLLRTALRRKLPREMRTNLDVDDCCSR